jgi:hypothetical protein
MSTWSITINDLDQISELPADVYDKACGNDAELQGDALGAFVTAKERGLVSATIAGGRTPSPYGGPDTVTISIVGFNNRNEGHATAPIAGRNFNATMVDTILAGPGKDDFDPDTWEYPSRPAYPDGDQ